MTNFDPELIAAVADGTLPPEEAAAAEARLMANPTARAELEAQRLALAALRSAAVPQLDDMERARLRRTVAAELDVIRPVAAPAPKRRFTMPWAALATAAAVLLVVVAAGPLLSLLTTSDGDSAADTTFLAETEAATEAAPAAGAEAPPATATAATTVVAEGAGDLAPDSPSVAALEVLPDLGELTRDGFTDEIGSRLALISRFEATDGTAADDNGIESARALLACEQRMPFLRPEAERITAVGLGTLEGEPVEVYEVAGADPAEVVFLAVAAASCEVVLEAR